MAKPRRIGFVTFQSNDGKYFMECLLGDGAATPTGGYGGWESKARARRRSFTIWSGVDPLSIDIPILIDYFAENDGVQCEKDIRQLEKMAGLEEHMGEPPLITFDSGGAIPHDETDTKGKRDYVIDDIQWGDVERNEWGNRTRQAAIVKVLQFVEDDALKNVSAAQRRKGKKKRAKRGDKKRGAKKKLYTVKSGDTLKKIAKHELGDSKRWHEIAKLNGIRDPDHITKSQELRLP